jgi:site-specific recombinase XerD
MPGENSSLTLVDAFNLYLENIRLARSAHTARTYKNAVNAFQKALKKNDLDPAKAAPSNLTEDHIAQFATYLKNLSPATESLYLIAVAGFYEFLNAENLASINLPRLRLLIRQRSRRPGQRLPQFTKDAIDEIIEKVSDLAGRPHENEPARLRDLRDRSFLITLADTGLRVHEACGLRRGDMDWNEGRAVIIGKGNREAVIRFSSRSIAALREYMSARSKLDGAAGRPLASLPIFARHDKGAGDKIKPITTTTGRNIVAERVREFLGDDAVGTITPHSFRHYFVTRVLRSSGNLKLAQELARHKNIAVTQRYAHLSDDELDKGYYEAIDQEK